MTTSHACRVCGSTPRLTFSSRVLGHTVDYFDCEDCGYFQTEQPYWLEQAYSSAINSVDTGILWRNQLNVRRVIMTLAAFGCLRGRVIDHAGGYGILVRLLRDTGVDAYWRDKYCTNLMARGFEAADGSCDVLTAFEVFEHMEHPLPELKRLLCEAPIVLLSTELISSGAPPDPDWWYLGPEHGQHIGFFRARTLAWMAQRLGCHHVSANQSLHLFSRSSVPRRWALLQRGLAAAPLIAKSMLHSRTMNDFERLRSLASSRR